MHVSAGKVAAAGPLRGARYGLGGIPREAVEQVDVLGPLLEVWRKCVTS